MNGWSPRWRAWHASTWPTTQPDLSVAMHVPPLRLLP
jgi:hypothetical protein